ncbi:secreted modular calcium-binding protein [Holotrichia oblita]|uniref:Secreted modular calcium-binding protein n=1 Tax=Holotrichia oblita TaxID=644536 RepID=A0ACB9SL07_HOLOL|nr:secreted modular calcium-binding protein [Holotrichia oblita]
MIFLLFLCSYLPVFVTSVEYYCDTDRFPVVTDFVPEDCDNSARFYYRENVVNDCFPACVQATSKSCYRYYTSGSNDYTRALWKPTCLPDETWAPKQCKGEAANGRCFCVDSEGNRIFGDAFSLDADDMTCACSRYRAALEASGDHVFVSLHCDSMGNYDPLQCDVNSEQCWCVEPKTGDLTSAVLPMNLMTKLPCYNETTVGSQYLRQCESEVYAQTMITDEFNAHGTERVNFETVLCQYDGSYGPYKISSGILYCVWKDGSSIGAYQVEVSSTIGSVNCNCACDTKIYQLAGLLFSLSCRSNGNYASLQMDGNLYYCVDSDGFATTESSDDDVCPEV